MIDALAEAVGRDVSRETYQQLQRYAEILGSEAKRHNLIAVSTLGSLWDRHILDSAQLVRLEPGPGASWVDIGSGAGLPGIVIATLVTGPMLLVEPRRLRAEFLERAIAKLGLGQRVSVAARNVQKVSGKFDVITARAVAALDRLLAISTHLSTRKTLWVLPKGRGAQSELAEARRSWQCEAETVPSRTDPDSEILLLREVKARGGR
ncbi:MAG: 16S rRNA (guanine(527)-N(7))-methyltransferase RsmG [Sphingomicrobium sp.]